MSVVPAGITVTGPLQHQAWIDRVLPPVEMVRPGLWSIPTIFPNNPLRYVLTYAVEYDGGIAIIDTGWPCQEAWDGLQSGLAEAGWTVEDIKAVLITHGHGDHMGLATRIRERSGAWVAIHEADSREAAAHGSNIMAEMDAWMVKRGGDSEDFRAVRNAHIKMDMFDDFELVPDRFLVPGEKPLGPNSDLISVWTPGHTPGHTCFFDVERNTLLSGDHILPRITPNISPAPWETDDVLGVYLDTLKSMYGMAVDEVLPAHEYRFRGFEERLTGLRQHHEVRLLEVMQVLWNSPGANSFEVTAGLHWSRPWDQMLGPQRRFAVGEAYAHLVHLEHTGFAVNKGTEVDSWYPLRDHGPTIV